MIIPLLISCEVRAFWYLYLYGIYIYINSIRGTAKLVLFPCNAITFLVCASQYQKFIVWWLEIQLCFPGTIVMWKPCWSLGFQTCHSFLEEKVTGLTFYTYIYIIYLCIQSRVVQKSNKGWFSLYCSFLFFRSMLMTACDLGAVTKPWEISRQASHD